MKFAIHDLSYEQLQIARASLNDACIPHGDAAPVMPTMPPAPAAPTVTTGPELDSAGMPWDERIHASTKTKTQKGEWKKRKGVDPSVTTAVEAEIKGVPDNMKLTADQITGADPSTAPAPMPPVLDQQIQEVHPTVIPTAPQQPVMTPAPQQPVEGEVASGWANEPGGVGITYEVMFNQAGAAMSDPNNPITPAHLPQLCQRYGLGSLNDARNNSQIITALYNHFVTGQL